MQRRAWISIVAAISLLAHAGFGARHNFLMLAQAQALLIGEMVICHSGGASDSTSGPLPQRPFDQRKPCPLCLGFGPSFAVLSGGSAKIEPPAFGIASRILASAPAPILGHMVAVPPSRGPPSTAFPRRFLA